MHRTLARGIRSWFFHAILFVSVSVSVSAVLLCPAGKTLAFSTMYSLTPEGENFFEIEFASKGEYFANEPKEISLWTMNNAQKRDVARAGSIWAEILYRGAKNKRPIYFQLTTNHDKDNASCGSSGTNNADPIDIMAVPRGIITGVLQKNMGTMTLGLPLPDKSAQAKILDPGQKIAKNNFQILCQ